MVPRAQPQTVKKRIAVIDDPTHVDINDDSDTECDFTVQPCTTTVCKEDVPTLQQPPETPSKSESCIPTPSEGWDTDSPGGICTSDGLESSLAERKYDSVCIKKYIRSIVAIFHIILIGMPKPDLIPETSMHENMDEKWRSVVISGLERKIDMRVIEPYKKVYRIKRIFTVDLYEILNLYCLTHCRCSLTVDTKERTAKPPSLFLAHVSYRIAVESITLTLWKIYFCNIKKTLVNYELDLL